MGDAVSPGHRTAPAQNASPAKRVEPDSTRAPSSSAVLRLQAQVGNRATQRFLAQRSLLSTPSSASNGFVIQRFEAGEHMQLGEVESMIVPDEGNHTVTGAPRTYKVKKGETPATIAVDLKVELDLLIARNASLYKSNKGGRHWFEAGAVLVVPGPPAAELARQLGVTPKALLDRNAATVNTSTSPHGGTVYQTFDRGATVVVPSGKMKRGGTQPSAKGAPQPGRDITDIQGVKFSYGEVIALGDFYETPDDMFKASKAELTKLKELMALDRANPGSVTTKQWQDATGGRFVDLATKNTKHFGPTNPAMTSTMGSISGANHRSEWDKYHTQALTIAQAGDKDKALTINAFGDHFLTDAFAAGHLFNKDDVMARFGAVFDKSAQKAFFEAVAKLAWANSGVSSRMSRLQSTAWHGANIDSESRFKDMLQAIYDDAEGKAQIHSTVAKVIHDKLNKEGVDVENAKGNTWKATGDAAINDSTREVAQEAVAQSQIQVMNAVGKSDALDLPALLKAVWDYTPRPTTAGTTAIHDAIEQLTKPGDSKMRGEAAALIIKEIDALADALIAKKKLEPIPP
jgi:hypothetical protein